MKIRGFFLKALGSLVVALSLGFILYQTAPMAQIGVPTTPDASSTEVPVPCDQTYIESSDQSLAENNCQIGLRSCTKVKADAVLFNKENFDLREMFLYHGLELDEHQSLSLESPTGNPTTPICDVCTNMSNLTSGDCGNTMRVIVADRDELQLQIGDGYGQAEFAAIGSLRALSLRKATIEVNQEIILGKLQVTHPGFQEAARDLNKLIGAPDGLLATAPRVQEVTLETLGGERVKTFCAQNENKKLKDNRTVSDLCGKLGSGSANYGTKDEVQHLLAACYIEASRMSIETAFKTLAKEEINYRAEEFYRTQIHPTDDITGTYRNVNDIDPSQALMRYIGQEVAQPCANAAGDGLNERRCAPPPIGMGPGNCRRRFRTRFNTCWQNNIFGKIKDFAEINIGSCAALADVTAGYDTSSGQSMGLEGMGSSEDISFE